MSIEARNRRTVARAVSTFKTLQASQSIAEQQDAWEAFLPNWVAAIQQLFAYATRNGKRDIRLKLETERDRDEILSYVWEARNQEGHGAMPSSYSALARISEAITINGERLTINGSSLTITPQTEPEPALVFRELSTRDAKRVFEALPFSAQFTAEEALKFLLSAEAQILGND